LLIHNKNRKVQVTVTVGVTCTEKTAWAVGVFGVCS